MNKKNFLTLLYMKKKSRKNKDNNLNQKSFFFEDYFEINQKKNTLLDLQYQKTEYIYYFSFF